MKTAELQTRVRIRPQWVETLAYGLAAHGMKNTAVALVRHYGTTEYLTKSGWRKAGVG